MSSKQRHTRHFPCPRCGGYDELPRGKAVRCPGFTVGDFTHCSRDELAGNLPQEAGGTYCHRMVGDCKCGIDHNGFRPAPISTGRAARPKRTAAEKLGPIVATYVYRDETGELGYEVLRYQPKTFRQRRPDGRGGFVWNLEGARRLLYRLPELLAADPAATVFYSPSEEDVERLVSLGQVATCNSEGDGKWPETCAHHFASRHVVFLCHNDKSGIAYGEQVAAALQGIAASIKVVRLPGLPEHGDVRDWLDAGHTIGELLDLVDVWPGWQRAPTAGDDPQLAEQLSELRRKLAAAEAKAHERLTFLNDIAELVADPSHGEEVRLWIGLAIAHYRNDPALQPIGENRWRLTQRLAQRLCGKGNLKTAGAYAVKLAERGALPLGPEEHKPFVKRDGHKADAYSLTYQWPPPRAQDDPNFGASTATVEANQPTLVARSRRLAAQRAKQEARGDARRFSGCPDHPHARVKMRRHCAVCDRCLEPRGEDVAATEPAPHPLQTLEPLSRESIQSLEHLPHCERCGSTLARAGATCRHCAEPPAELLADLAALPEAPPEPLQSLERPRILRGDALTAFLEQRERQLAAAGGA